MTHDAMTHDTVRPANEVRILELEVQKLELEKQITELETEETIDEGYIGCAGPCKVVDAAANLQKELDECSNMNSSLHEDIEGLKADYGIMHTIHLNTVAKLQNDIAAKDRAHTLDMDTIQELWGIIHDFREGYGASRMFVDAVLIRNLKGDIEGLEAELSARKEDSEVLMKVVEAIRAWNISPIEPRGTIHGIRNVVKDYLDVPEGPETPIDDLYRTTVSVFLEMP